MPLVQKQACPVEGPRPAAGAGACSRQAGLGAVMQDQTGALGGTGFQDPTGRTPEERPRGLAEVVVGERAGKCCRDPGSREGHRDVGLSPAERCVQGSGGGESDPVRGRGLQDDLTKSDDPCLRTRGHFRTLLRRRLVNSSERRSEEFSVGSHEYSTNRPAVLLPLLASPVRAVFTLEVGVGSAEPLFVARTWTKVTPSRDTCTRPCARPWTGPDRRTSRAGHWREPIVLGRQEGWPITWDG